MKSNHVKTTFFKGLSLLIGGVFLFTSTIGPFNRPGSLKQQTLASASFFTLPTGQKPELPFPILKMSKELQKIDKQVRSQNWQTKMVEDQAKALAPEKKAELNQAMTTFVAKQGKRLSQIRSLPMMLKVLQNPQNSHFYKYAHDVEKIIAKAMSVPIYFNKDTFTAHVTGPFAHARRGISTDAQDQTREPVIWLGTKLFDYPDEITNEDLALLLLEEAQHIVFPDRPHGEGKEEIDHSPALRQKLEQVATSHHIFYDQKVCEADLSSDEIREKIAEARIELRDENPYIWRDAIKRIIPLTLGISDDRLKQEVIKDLYRLLTSNDYSRWQLINNTCSFVMRDILKFRIIFAMLDVVNMLFALILFKRISWNVKHTIINAMTKCASTISDDSTKLEIINDLRLQLNNKKWYVQKAAINVVAELASAISDDLIKLEIIDELFVSLTTDNTFRETILAVFLLFSIFLTIGIILLFNNVLLGMTALSLFVLIFASRNTWLNNKRDAAQGIVKFGKILSNRDFKYTVFNKLCALQTDRYVLSGIKSLFSRALSLIFSTLFSFEEGLEFLLFSKIPNTENKKWFLLEKLFEGFSTSGGKIHLNLKKGTESRQQIVQIAERIGFITQGHGWYNQDGDSLEVHFLPANNPFTLLKTMDFFLGDVQVKEILTDFLSNEPQNKQAFCLQPTLKVEGLFWDASGNLKKEAKMLALSLMAASSARALQYTDELPKSVDTYGLLVDGGGVLYEQFSSDTKDRADLWGVVYLFLRDLLENGHVAEYERMFRRYHLIGNAVVSLYKPKQDAMDQELAVIASGFFKEANRLFQETEVYEALSIEWKRGNWEKLKEKLMTINLRKAPLPAEIKKHFSEQIQNKIDEEMIAYQVEIEGEELYLRDAMEKLLKTTELKILDVVLSRYAAQIDNNLSLEKQLEKMVEAMEATQYHIISGYDEAGLAAKALDLLGYELEEEEGYEDDYQSHPEFPNSDAAWDADDFDNGDEESPDLASNALPHEERNHQLLREIHNGNIFEISLQSMIPLELSVLGKKEFEVAI